MSDNRWVDLANCDQKALFRQCDVCIVGAGAAGIYLAVELANRGSVSYTHLTLPTKRIV